MGLYSVGERVKHHIKGGPEVEGTVTKVWDKRGEVTYEVKFEKDPWGPFYEEELSKVE